MGAEGDGRFEQPVDHFVARHTPGIDPVVDGPFSDQMRCLREERVAKDRPSFSYPGFYGLNRLIFSSDIYLLPSS